MSAAAHPGAIAIALVDDHRVVTASLKMYLESFADLRVVGIAGSGEDLLRHMATWKPQVVLLDLLMPGGIDGLEVTRRAIRAWPDTRVIALTASTDEARLMGVLKAGAVGYLRKGAEPELLVAAVRAVARGRTFIDPAVVQQLERTAQTPHDLTEREIDVLRHVAIGRTNREIADALGVAEETVKTHVSHVLEKLRADNRGQAVVQALKRGLLVLDELE